MGSVSCAQGQARLLLLPDKGPESQQDSSWEELGEELLPSCLLRNISQEGKKPSSSHTPAAPVSPPLAPLQPPPFRAARRT